jgi:hypothetical protein
MAKTLPFPRNAQATHARQAKAALLPMPRATADELALRVHLALDTLRRGKGGNLDAQTLTQALILAGFLVDLGYGKLAPEQVRVADTLVAACFSRGRAADEWRLDDEGVAAFMMVVSLYDWQLHSAPLWAVAEASDRLDRFTAGGNLPLAQRKRA